MSSALKAIALYNFQPSAPVELALQKGDVVIVRNVNAGDGWSEGELHGQRGLFPLSFVRMLDELTDGSPPLINSPQHSLSSVPTPLTPQSTKKTFMETLLTPTPNTIADVFDQERAAELFATDHKDMQISAGPRWSHKPPSLTITVADGLKPVRSSGMRLHKFYEVRTKELKVVVQRKYKHFLWLYDQLAEKCPCISLPPLPIKHGLPSDSEDDSKESRRRGLEKFLNRLARHPILGCTKVLHIFLIATDDKEWRIGGAGKHSSFIKGVGSKNNKRLFAAPIFNCVHYPPYNVPLNQLPAFDKFTKFSETLESNVSNLIRSCELLKSCHGRMSKCIKIVGNDMQMLSRGGTPSLSGRYLRKPSQGISLPSHHPASPQEESGDEEEIEQDLPEAREWNWRDDDNFSKLMIELQVLSDKMRHLAIQHSEHQELLEIDVIEGLEEYSGIIHTLPVLVKKHEEAMAAFNLCKEKGTKKEAETMRQDCETLNNILLSELDYFSTLMIEDFQTIFLKLLKAQADYHKKLSLEWETMHDNFYENRPIRRATVKRSTTIPGSKIVTNGHATVKRPASTEETIGPPVSRTYLHKQPEGNQETATESEHVYADVSQLSSPKFNKDTIVEYENVVVGNNKSTIENLPLIESSSVTSDDSVSHKESTKSLSKTGNEIDTDQSLKESPKQSSGYSPRMHTKLAKMTKLPSTRPGPSNSFSQVQQPFPKKISTTRTLPRTLPSSNNNDNSGNELFQKLEKRRQKLERQLTGDEEDRNSKDTGVLRWTRDCDNTSLSKFGIIEEGGTFTV